MVADAWLELDTELRQRLRDVLADPPRPVTEAELRRLLEEGQACTRILGAELERLERRLAQLDSDPDSSLGEIAGAFRRVHDFRVHVDALDELMSALARRAQEVRTTWREQAVRRP
jgi:chromosome segregation ATPase